MTSKETFFAIWEMKTAVERRERLNVLGAQSKDDEEQREHDVLAAMVAEDEING